MERIFTRATDDVPLSDTDACFRGLAPHLAHSADTHDYGLICVCLGADFCCAGQDWRRGDNRSLKCSDCKVQWGLLLDCHQSAEHRNALLFMSAAALLSTSQSHGCNIVPIVIYYVYIYSHIYSIYAYSSSFIPRCFYMPCFYSDSMYCSFVQQCISYVIPESQ